MPKKQNKKLNKKQALITVFIAVVLIAISFGIIVAIRDSSLPVFDGGNELSVISLPAAKADTHEWTIEYENPNIVELYEKKSVSGENGENQQFVFKAKKAGVTNVKFRYGSFANGTIESERTYKIEVNRDLKIRVTEL